METEKEAEAEMAEAVAGGKRKAEASGELDATEAAADEDTLVLAPGEAYVDLATGVKWVDMPDDYLSWVLSQKRLPSPTYDPRKSTTMSQEEIERELATMARLDTMLAGVKDEFFEFQAWVRETYGRVLVPEDTIPEAFTSEE